MQGSDTSVAAAMPRCRDSPSVRCCCAPAAWPQKVSIADTVPMTRDNPAERSGKAPSQPLEHYCACGCVIAICDQTSVSTGHMSWLSGRRACKLMNV